MFDHVEPYNAENLQKLYDYLISGQLQAFFNMAVYAECEKTYADNCGSVGCAVGHGPYAGIPKLKDENWNDYSKRCFTESASIWRWLFSPEWQCYDNTAQGAAQRIFWLLHKGASPKYWGIDSGTVKLYQSYYNAKK